MKKHEVRGESYDLDDLVMFERVVYSIIAIDGEKEYYTLYGFDSKTMYIPFCEENQLVKIGTRC